MDTLRTEDEQIESIKSWWKKNGKQFVVSAALIFGGGIGWQLWQDDKRENADAASIATENVLHTLGSGQMDDAKQQAQQIMQDYKETLYSSYAAFVAAKVQFEQEKYAAAAKSLQQIIAHEQDVGLLKIAHARLARVLFSQQKYDEALVELGQKDSSFYDVLYEELRGDILHARGDVVLARKAYQRALDNAETLQHEQIEMKINNLVERTTTQQS